MSYLNHAQDPARRAKAIVGVGAIHAVIGYVLITGLGAEIVEQLVPPPLIGTTVPLPPPPLSDDPPPPPPDAKVPPPTVPLPPIPIPRGPLLEREAFDEDTLLVPLVPRVPESDAVAPPSLPARPLFTPSRARPSNDPRRWITTDDYPGRALRAEAEGVAGYRLMIGTNGRPTACDVTRSTGNGQLDQATCDFILRRARFEAATDDTGAKVMGSYTGTVKWEIPE